MIGRTGLLFRRRESSWATARLVPLGGARVRETQQEDSMKYLLMLLAATALIGTASAT